MYKKIRGRYPQAKSKVQAEFAKKAQQERVRRKELCCILASTDEREETGLETT